MKNEQVKQTMKGAIILSFASLIAKILSAVYRIPFENIVGNTGFYVYQQVYPIYGIGVAFALTGFPVYISKLVAEQQNEEKQTKLLQQLFLILSFFAIIIFLGLRFFAPLIAKMMGDMELTALINAVSWMFLFMPILAVGRGYYQGTFDMVPTAISQVTEQIVRVLVIILAAIAFARFDWSFYKMGTVSMLASSAGAFVACLSFIKYYRSFFFKKTTAKSFSYLYLTEKLFTDGLIICLFASTMVLLQLVDSFTLVRGLMSNGIFPAHAKELKGIYDRAQPLLQLGMVLAVGFSSTLLPALSAALQQKRYADFRRISKVMLRISVTISVAASCGMVVLMPQINTLLFGDADLSREISVYVLSVIFITLIGTYNSILQSLDQFLLTVVALIAAIITKFALNLWLIHRLNVMGASLATVISLIVALVIILAFRPDIVKRSFSKGHFWLKLIFATFLMIAGVRIFTNIYQLFIGNSRFDALVMSLGGALIGVTIFFSCALWFKLFSVREWLMLPGGKKILKIWQKLNEKR